MTERNGFDAAHIAVLVLVVVGVLLLMFLMLWPEPETKQTDHPIKTETAKGADPAHIALANAARKYGVDPVLFLAISRFETAKTFSPLIGPKTSSALGLCQMIKATRKSYGVEPKKYNRSKGPYISHLISEAEGQADACARFTRDQIKAIRSLLPEKRKPTPGEIYLCHLLGLGACRVVINAAPGATVASVTSKAARKANPFIRRQKTAGSLRIAASRMIRAQMQHVVVPSEDVCRVQ